MQNENKGCTMCIVGKKEIQQTIEPIKQMHLEYTHLKCTQLAKVIKNNNEKSSTPTHSYN